MKIKDKVAVVTGGASGIGRAVSFQLAQLGVKKIALVDMTDAVDEAVKEINKETKSDVAIAYKGDTTDTEFRKKVFTELSERYGMVQICIPAAGITRDALAVRVDRETGQAGIYPQEKFEQVVNVNLIAPVYWAMEMVACIAEDRYKNGLKKWHADEGVQGTIIFIGSISSQGNKGQISYASTKAGL
ncbi:MAG: SDR family NAD(P)-dependent oxidoreductase, partial [Thiotrichales bacterium]|nr:SDR family NAD(P)-dependent oxidoreductase [Thiotrichales bacterium]